MTVAAAVFIFNRTCDVHAELKVNSGQITVNLINCYRKSWTFYVVACYSSHQTSDTLEKQFFIIALPGFPKMFNYRLLYYIDVFLNRHRMYLFTCTGLPVKI